MSGKAMVNFTIRLTEKEGWEADESDSGVQFQQQ